MDKTVLFSLEEIKNAEIAHTLHEVYLSLKERGYNPTSQLIGYLLSGDPTYITSYKDARKKIAKFSREEVLMAIINGYLGR
jgi:uncharacterized protein (UPF0297 family)